MSSKRQSVDSTNDHPLNEKKNGKKILKYWNPQNSNWSESAYQRDLDVIPNRQDLPTLMSHNQGVYKNPLLKEAMYPMTQSVPHYHSQSDVQDDAHASDSLTSHNQGMKLSSRKLNNKHDEATGSSLMSHNQGVGTQITFASFAAHWNSVPKEVIDGLNTELKNYLPPKPDSNLVDDWYGDNVDEGSYYYPATDISELNERISLSDKHNCLAIVRYLRIDWIRLAMRPIHRDGGYGNIDTASTFLEKLISYFERIDRNHSILKFIDQAWFVITYIRRNVYIHENTPAQTGKAVTVAKTVSSDSTKLGSVDYFNPLFLLLQLTIDQQIYIGKMVLPEKLMTNRKAKLLDRLAQCWKISSQAKRKEFFDTVGRALQYLTILSPLSVLHRAVSAQALRRIKGSKFITDTIAFAVFLTDFKCGVFILCAPLPERLDPETRVKHLESEPHIREKSMIAYPNNLKVFINGKLFNDKLYDTINGHILPREINDSLKMGNWNTFYITFDLDETVFKKGLVLHVVHAKFKVGHITLHES